MPMRPSAAPSSPWTLLAIQVRPRSASTPQNRERYETSAPTAPARIRLTLASPRTASEGGEAARGSKPLVADAGAAGAASGKSRTRKPRASALLRSFMVMPLVAMRMPRRQETFLGLLTFERRQVRQQFHTSEQV